MIVCLNTSTPVCELTFIDGDWQYATTWESGRGLAKGILEFFEAQLSSQQKTWQDVTGLIVFQGPGSFTGLRIGITVMNSLAYARDVPIVGAMGDDWKTVGLQKLAQGENDKIVLPEYGGEANITKPRK